MNDKQRNQYSKDYLRVQGKLERRFLPIINKVLSNQISSFTDRFLSRGFYLESDFQRVKGTEMSLVIATLHIYSGIVWGTEVFKRLKQTKAGNMGYNEDWTKQILKYFRDHNLKLVKNITDVTRERIKQVLAEGIEKGYGAEKLARMLKSDKLTKARALRIVRTETVRATNYANFLSAEELGFVNDKIWIAAHDERTRKGHIEADKKDPIDFDDLFTVPVYDHKGQFVKNDYMMYPGDPTASPENTINCRCTVSFIPVRDRDGNLVERPKPEIIVPEMAVQESVSELFLQILQGSVIGFLLTDLLSLSDAIKTFTKEIFKGIGLLSVIEDLIK